MTSERPRGDYLSDPDTQLMVRFAEGDERAFDRIVENFRNQVFGIIHRYVGDWAAAEDCSQEVFLRIYRLKSSYTPTARLSTLVYRITTNLCLNVVRDASKRQAVSLDAPHGPEGPPLGATLEHASAEAPGDALEARERAEMVWKALSRIPDRQRIALILHRFEALSYAEIAQALETNVDAVKALLSRARQSLADALRADLEAGNL